jgi:hypothetical protein
LTLNLQTLVSHDKLEHKNGFKGRIFTNLALALVVGVYLIRVECFEAAYLFALATVELADFIEVVWLN